MLFEVEMRGSLKIWLLVRNSFKVIIFTIFRGEHFSRIYCWHSVRCCNTCCGWLSNSWGLSLLFYRLKSRILLLWGQRLCHLSGLWGSAQPLQVHLPGVPVAPKEAPGVFSGVPAPAATVVVVFSSVPPPAPSSVPSPTQPIDLTPWYCLLWAFVLFAFVNFWWRKMGVLLVMDVSVSCCYTWHLVSVLVWFRFAFGLLLKLKDTFLYYGYLVLLFVIVFCQ